MFLVENQRSIALANSTAERLFGFAPGGLHGVALEELIPVADRAAHDELVENFFQNPRSITMVRGRELTALGRDGSQIPVEIGLTPLLWSGSTFVLASIVDISERYQQKKMLEEANHGFDRAISGVADGMWEWTIGEELWMSDQFFKILGYDPAVVQGSYSFWFERIHPEDQQPVLKQLDAHLTEGLSFNTEQRILCEDGEYRWFLSRGDSFINSKTGKPCMSGFVSDIHRRKMAEAKLSEKTQFLNNIYNGIHHGIFVIDVTDDNDFRFAAFNPAEERLTGISFEDIRDKRPEDLCPKYLPLEAVREIRANYQRCLDERQEIKYVEMIPFKDGNTWWLTSLTPLMDENNRIFRLIGSASEITSLKQMEIAIRENEEFSRKILDHSLNGLYIFDLVSNLNKYINPAYSRITGYSLEDLHGADLVGLFHPDEVELLFNHMAEVAGSEDGRSVEIGYRFLHKAGHWIWCLSRDAVFTRDEHGRAIEMIGTFIDITDIKNYRHILEQSNRELEQFAFIASHDLREPLRKIKSFGDLLVSRFKSELPEKVQDYVNRMTGAAERLDLMINDLLAFSRVSQHLNLELTHLNNVLTNDYLAKEEITPPLVKRTILFNIQRKLTETSNRQSEARFCQMAEISSSTLHNIGNVLNNLTVSSQATEDMLRQINPARLTDVAKLLWKTHIWPRIQRVA